MPTVHTSAWAGFTMEAEAYLRGRPEYPPEVARWLVARTGLGPGSIGLNVGAGTGKFTRLTVDTPGPR